MPNVDDFRNELKAQIERAQRQGRPHVEVNAGELHRIVGDYPGQSHRMPMCCQAMRDAFNKNTDEVIFEPPEGQGASLTVRYRLPR